MYRRIIYKAGATREIINCYPRGMRKGVEHNLLGKKTSEEMQEANRRQARRKLERLINANFRPGDWHITLTYRGKASPSPEAAKKELTNFLERLRNRFRKFGYELKYIVATEYVAKHIHHHMIVNNINTGSETTADMVRKLWTQNGPEAIRGNPKYVQLYDTGEYSQLADYLIKETERSFRRKDSAVGQRYSCSRNLIQPKKTTKDKPNKTWKKEPRPSPGYYILPDSLYNGFDMLGYPYQRYVEVKLNPTDADWETQKTPSGHVTKGTRSHSTSHRPRAGGERSRNEKHQQSRKRDHG